MAPASTRKRKRNSTTSAATPATNNKSALQDSDSDFTPSRNTRKKQRRSTRSPSPEAEQSKPEQSDSFDDSEENTNEYWKARAILKETSSRYLIDWAPNEKTGEEYPPNWEPKSAANQALVDDWKRRKEEKRKGTGKKRGRPPKKKSKTETPKKQQRKKPIVESSPASTQQEEKPKTPEPEPTPEADSTLLNFSFATPNSPAPEADQRTATEPNQESAPNTIQKAEPETIPESTSPGGKGAKSIEAVVISQRGDDFDRSAYDVFSEVHPTADTQGASPLTGPDSTAPENSAPDNSNYIPAEELLRPPSFGDTIIPDSQEPDDSSYVPDTQSNEVSQPEPTQHSQNTNEVSQPLPTQHSEKTNETSSASAQYTSGRTSSAPIPETDPIEDGSSPEAHEPAQFALLQEDSPRRSTSSASSPPPTETPEKSQSRSQSQPHSQTQHQSQYQPEASEQPDASEQLETSEDSRPPQEEQEIVLDEEPFQQTEEPFQQTEEPIDEAPQAQQEELIADTQEHAEQSPTQDAEESERDGVDVCDQEQEDYTVLKDFEPEPESVDVNAQEQIRQEPTEEAVQLEPEPVEQTAQEPVEEVKQHEHDSSDVTTQEETQDASNTSKDPDKPLESPDHGEKETGIESGAQEPDKEQSPGLTQLVDPSVEDNSLRVDQSKEQPEQVTAAEETSGDNQGSEDSEQTPADISTPVLEVERAETDVGNRQTEPNKEVAAQPEVERRKEKSPEETPAHVDAPAPILEQNPAPLSQNNPASFDLEPTSVSVVRKESPKPVSSQHVSSQVATESDCRDKPRVPKQTLFTAHDRPQSPLAEILQSIELRTARENRESSSFPSPPFGSPFGSNPPSRLSTLSPGMPESPVAARATSSTSSPALSLTEKLARSRAKNKAECEAKKERIRQSHSRDPSTRSPSVIPAYTPQPASPAGQRQRSKLSTMNRPDEPKEQAETGGHLADSVAMDMDVDMPTEGEGVSSSGTETPGILLNEPRSGKAEYLVGLSMEGLQGDEYRRALKFKEDVIRKFTETDCSHDPIAIQQIEELLNDMRKITTHVDLAFRDADALTQYDNTEEEMVAWSQNSSAKFRFLGHVLDRLRDRDMHLMVLVSPGKLTDIAETFLKGKGVRYSRGDRPNGSFTDGDSLLKVSITQEGCDNFPLNADAADLLIALDQSVNLVWDHMDRYWDEYKTLPIITPLITNSLEHIDRCLQPHITSNHVEELRLRIRLVTELRILAGRIDQSSKPAEVADLVVSALDTPGLAKDAWPILRVGTIKDFVKLDESALSQLPPPPAPVDTLDPSAANKRPLDFEGNQEANKKMRLTPQPQSDTINPNELTHISDSITGPSVPGSAAANEIAYGGDRKDSEEYQRIRFLEGKQKELEEALEICQGEREDMRDEMLRLRRELTETKTTAASLILKREQQTKTVDKLIAEKLELQEALAEARKALESSNIPGVAEREALRRERDEERAARKRAETARDNESRNLEFFRTQYQDASSSASAANGENEQLTKRVRELEHRASGETARAKQLSLDAGLKRFGDENEMLRLKLRDSEEIIKRQNEELRALKQRQGVGTRAGSVPRSPRIVGNGPGSRSGSPAPSGLGGRIERLRNLNA